MPGAQLEVQARHSGVKGSLRLLPAPPTWGSPLQSRNPGLSLPSRPEAMAREGPTLPSGSLRPSVRFFKFLRLSSTNFLANKYLFCYFQNKETKKKKNKQKKNSEASEGWGTKRKLNREVQSALRSSLDATKTVQNLAVGLAAPGLDQAGLLRTKLSGRLGRW